MGLVARGLGVAVKCVDGASRALGPAAVAVLEHLDALGEEEARRLAEVARPSVRNHAGREVGRLEARLEGAKP
jgi:L-asparaginase II